MADASQMHAISGLMQGESSEGNKDKCCSDRDRIAPEGVRKEFNFWTDQEVWLLLDAYEEKWNQLDRGNVKSKHWEEISARLSAANHHSSASGSSWAAKTPTQCKNKIEDMKKKFRAEKALKQGNASFSKWVFFQRMESMLRNGLKAIDNGEHASQQQPNVLELDSYQLDALQFRQHCKELHDGNEEVDTSFTTPQQQHQHHQQHHHVGRKENGGLTGLLLRDDQVLPSGKRKRSSGGGGGGVSEVVAAIKSFGESLLRIEEAQVQMQREVVRMNGEAELRRIEMEVKRTEMMLSTQLQIAKLFASGGGGKAGRKKKVVRRVENGGVAASQDIDLDE